MGTRGSRAALGAPERWAPLAGLLLLVVGYAALGRWFKVGIVLAVAGAVALIVAIGRAHEPEATGRARVLRWLPAIVPLSLAYLIDLQPGFVESLLSDPERRWRTSILLLAAGFTAGVLILIGVDVRAAIARFVHRITSALRTGVAVLLYVVVLLPLGMAHLWRRADPLRTGATATGSAWHPATASGARLATRTYRSERPLPQDRTSHGSRPVRFANGLLKAIGIVVVVVLVDLGLGLAWNAVDADDSSASGPDTAVGVIRIGQATEGLEPIDLDAPDAEVHPPDPREDLPAMAKYPWRHEYFQELQRAETTYWPYLMWLPMPANGKYVNIDRLGERRSYRSPGATGDDVPDVDFYGGSTTYGEGQRDQHTIPSEVVRLAEADGLPIRAHNRGVRGWVAWQEMLLFEQISADPDIRPDIALFYDGANEYAAQSEAIRGVPAHTSLDAISVTLSGKNSVAAQAGRVDETPDDVGMWGHVQLLGRDYVETSAIARAGRWMKDTVTGEPAGAAPSQAIPPSQFNHSSKDVQPIYRRGQAIIDGIAERRGVDVLYFWQPLQDGGWAHYDEDVRAPTIDLSQAFIGHDDIFIDGTHHNEDGSVIAAEALWEHLKPRVQAWYDAQ